MYKWQVDLDAKMFMISMKCCTLIGNVVLVGRQELLVVGRLQIFDALF